MANPKSIDPNCTQIAKQICATLAAIVQEIKQQTRHTPTEHNDNQLQNQDQPKQPQKLLNCGYMEDEECLCEVTDSIQSVSQDENEKDDVDLDFKEEESRQGQLQIQQEGDGLIVAAEVGAVEGFQMQMECPKSSIHQVCNQFGHDRIDSCPENEFSSPLTWTPLVVRDSLQIKWRLNIANKVFDIMPEWDGYIPKLNPKPPDEVKVPGSTSFEYDDVKISKQNLVKFAGLSIGPMGEHDGAIKPFRTRPSRKGWEESKGFIIFALTGGPEYHVSQVVNAVLVARYLGATLVLLDIIGNKPGDKRKFGEIYDIHKFETSLNGVIKIANTPPAEVSGEKPTIEMVPNGASKNYVTSKIEPFFNNRKGNLKLVTCFLTSAVTNLERTKYMNLVSCLAVFEALQLQAGLQEVVDLILKSLRTLSRKSDGLFVAVDLRVEMMGTKGCQESRASGRKNCYSAREIGLERIGTPIAGLQTMQEQQGNLLQGNVPTLEPINILLNTYPGHSHSHTSYSFNDLPKTVAPNLNQGSAVTSMDFHPVQQIILLVSDVAVWKVSSRGRFVFKNFKIWDYGACSMTLQTLVANKYTVSVNCMMWIPNGTLFGVAYSKDIVHIYSFDGSDDLRNYLEIDVHVGNVSDLAFSHPNKQLCIRTCGDDKAIKIWDVVMGAKQYTFEGLEAYIYYVCPPHYKENIQFIFSTSVDGKIKAWLYDHLGSRVDYDAPGQSYTKMTYGADGTEHKIIGGVGIREIWFVFENGVYIAFYNAFMECLKVWFDNVHNPKKYQNRLQHFDEIFKSFPGVIDSNVQRNILVMQAIKGDSADLKFGTAKCASAKEFGNKKIVDSVVSHGGFLTDCFIKHNVAGIRFWTNSNVSLKNILMYGAGYYERAGYYNKDGYGFMVIERIPVYEGTKSFYKEEDETVPINVYGKSKGEEEREE